jgi:predicted transcriptional regulator
MKRIVVDDVMNEPVEEVDVMDTVKKALSKMESRGTKKILVKSGDNPVGVLEKWKITDADLNNKIKSIELGKHELVPRGTDMEKVESLLHSSSAVYVIDPRQNNKIVGVVTTFDLMKSF